MMKVDPSPAVTTWLSRRGGGVLWTTAICQAEILAGIGIMPDGRRRRNLARSADLLFEEFFDRLLVFDGGRPIMPFDAAIARANGAGVATRNVGHFVDCGIPVHDPWQGAVAGN